MCKSWIWKKTILSDLLDNEVYYDEHKNFFVSFKQNTFQKRMREKENKTDQHNKLAQQVQERNKKDREKMISFVHFINKIWQGKNGEKHRVQKDKFFSFFL